MPAHKLPDDERRNALARVRVLSAALLRYEQRADQLGIPRSTLLRRMLTFAEDHMPDDYTEEKA